MAFTNVLTGNPMKIGTAMGSSYKSQVAASLGTLFTLQVEKLQWEPVNAGDYLRIVDPQSGALLAEIETPAGGGTGTYFLDWTAHPKSWRDFLVNQIDSGILYIFTR